MARSIAETYVAVYPRSTNEMKKMKPTHTTLTIAHALVCCFYFAAFECDAQLTNAEALVIKFKSLQFERHQFSYHLQSAEAGTIQLELKTNGRPCKVITFDLPEGMPQLLSNATIAATELGTNQARVRYDKSAWEVSISVSNGPAVDRALMPSSSDGLAAFMDARPSFHKLIKSTERHVPRLYRVVHDPEYTPGFFKTP